MEKEAPWCWKEASQWDVLEGQKEAEFREKVRNLLNFACSHFPVPVWAVEEPQAEGMPLQQGYLTAGTMAEESRVGGGQQWVFPL